MNEQEKERKAAKIAGEVASKWQMRSRLAVLIGVVAAGYLVDYLFFRYERAGEFTLLVAFLAHIGLQVWVPEKVYNRVFRETLEATLKIL